MEEPEMLTVGEAAKEKGVHLKSVYRAIKEERLPARKVYGVLVIARADLEAWTPWQPPRRKRTRKRRSE